MDTNTYDLGKLDFDELLELQALQRKMQDVNAPKVRTRRSDQEPEEPEDLARLTLEEMIALHRLFLKMANEPYSWERVSVDLGADGKWYYKNGEPYTWEREPTKKTYCQWCGHALGGVTYTNSRVGPCCSEQCLENSTLARQRRVSGVSAAPEPVAIAPAAAPAKPAESGAPAQPEKLKLPADSVMSAARQLDGLMRFGYDLPEEPR